MTPEEKERREATEEEVAELQLRLSKVEAFLSAVAHQWEKHPEVSK